jgi:hypothetical protein
MCICYIINVIGIYKIYMYLIYLIANFTPRFFIHFIYNPNIFKIIRPDRDIDNMLSTSLVKNMNNLFEIHVFVLGNFNIYSTWWHYILHRWIWINSSIILHLTVMSEVSCVRVVSDVEVKLPAYVIHNYLNVCHPCCKTHTSNALNTWHQSSTVSNGHQINPRIDN